MRIKKVVMAFVVFMFFLAGIVNAQQQPPESFNALDGLDLKFGFNANIDITLLQPGTTIDEMKVDLSFFPRDNDFQSTQSLQHTSSPPASISTSDNYITYLWENIRENQKLTYGIDAIISTKNYIPPITTKIPFPVTNLDPMYYKYTQPSPFIDITPAIEQQASSIIGSESDLYVAVFKVADWTKNNIEYDLSTLTAEAVQKSSWVLENRRGVCDELTNLFVSMLRSVGIPAKFVSGMVYSNLDNKWGPHGWAEVYFPGYGWVPFDVTFGQYGWLDPSHLKLKDDADSGSPSAEYSWKSTGREDVDVGKAQLSTTLISKGEEVQPFVRMDIEPYKKEVGPGSYVPLLVTLENQQNIYFSPTVIVRKAPGIEGSNVKQVLLHPKESKTIAWLVKIPSGAEENFIYTSTLEVEATAANTATSAVKYAENYPPMTREQAEAIVNSFEEQSEKSRLETVTFRCKADEDIYYASDPVKITCTLASRDKQALHLTACVQQECRQLSLEPGKTDDLTFSLTASQSGRFIATVEDKKRVLYTPITLNVIAVPDITITDIKPSTITYGEKVTLSFAINTNTPLKEVNLDFGFDQLTFDEIDEKKSINIHTTSANLVNGLAFTLVYQDMKGKVYQTKQNIQITVTDVPWYARIVFWMAKFFQ